jgi:hypothetical protein
MPHSEPPASTLFGLMILLWVAVVVLSATVRALRDLTPPRVQNAVKTGVLALVWLNVGVVLAVRGTSAVLPVATL